jgi:alkylation response protein AidB-like acyl-CoA dehydrogenase
MGVAMTADQVALQRTIRAWATSSRAADVVRRREPGAADTSAEWSRLWSGLADLGVLSIAVPDEVGGTGGSLLDLAAALEETAAAIIPGPVLPSALAGVLISRHGTPDAAKALAPSLADGSLPAAVTLTAAEVTGRRTPGGGLRVSGHAGAVLGATPDAQLVLAAAVGADEVWFTLSPQHPGVTARPVTAVDTSRPLAHVDLADVEVPTDAVLTGLTSAEVTDLAAVLATAEAAGIAGWTLQTATEYARTRHQFGRPIGGFQAVKHLCAQMLVRAETARAAVYAAAVTADPVDIAAARLLADEAAERGARDCLQVHGGMGFTWECEVQLHLKRAWVRARRGGGGAESEELLAVDLLA